MKPKVYQLYAKGNKPDLFVVVFTGKIKVVDTKTSSYVTVDNYALHGYYGYELVGEINELENERRKIKYGARD